MIPPVSWTVLHQAHPLPRDGALSQASNAKKALTVAHKHQANAVLLQQVSVAWKDLMGQGALSTWKVHIPSWKMAALQHGGIVHLTLFHQ
jgi:hypothetical protein